MKTKAYIKQGSYQRSSKKINGALDVNKEVLDTLVDKEVLGTVNCCQYFLKLPQIGVDFLSEELVPIGGMFLTESGDTIAFKGSDGSIFTVLNG